MSFVEISAYKCTCERCAHSWTAVTIPRTCSKCRSPYWDVPKGNRVSLAASVAPLVVEDKKDELLGLRNIIKSIESKPKSDYHTKSILPTYPPKVDDQYDPYSEPTVNYE